MGRLKALQLGQLLFDACSLHDERVTGGEGLHLRVRQRLVADVVDRAFGHVASHHLVDEGGLAFDGLPTEHVETAFGDVPDHLDFLVLVALPQYSAVSLFEIGRSPGAVHVMEGEGSVLHIRTHPHLLRRADQHGDAPCPRRRKQARLLGIVPSFVHEPNGLPWDAAGDQLGPQLVVDRPTIVAVWSPEVTKDQLQSPRAWRLDAISVEVHTVEALAIDTTDAICRHGDLAPGRVRGQAHQPKVQRGFASVSGDLQHVVFFGPHHPVPDLLRSIGQGSDVLGELGGGGHHHGFRFVTDQARGE